MDILLDFGIVAAEVIGLILLSFILGWKLRGLSQPCITRTTNAGITMTEAPHSVKLPEVVEKSLDDEFGMRSMDGLLAARRIALLAYKSGVEAVKWQDLAYARLGFVRDKMHPSDVEIVQDFIAASRPEPPIVASVMEGE